MSGLESFHDSDMPAERADTRFNPLRSPNKKPGHLPVRLQEDECSLAQIESAVDTVREVSTNYSLTNY